MWKNIGRRSSCDCFDPWVALKMSWRGVASDVSCLIWWMLLHVCMLMYVCWMFCWMFFFFCYSFFLGFKNAGIVWWDSEKGWKVVVVLLLVLPSLIVTLVFSFCWLLCWFLIDTAFDLPSSVLFIRRNSVLSKTHKVNLLYFCIRVLYRCSIFGTQSSDPRK